MLEAACNKLSYENFDKIYAIIRGAIEDAVSEPGTGGLVGTVERTKRDVVVAIVKRACSSGSYIDLYVRALKRLQRDGMGVAVLSAVSRMAAEFRDDGLLVHTISEDAEYDAFCSHLLDKRTRLGLLKVLVRACEPGDVAALADAVLKDFAAAVADPGYAVDLVFDGVAVVHELCPDMRAAASSAVRRARDAGGLSNRSKFQAMDLLEDASPSSRDKCVRRTTALSRVAETTRARAGRQ